jgi:hypothetical protein
VIAVPLPRQNKPIPNSERSTTMPRIPGTTNRQSAFLRSFRLRADPPLDTRPSRAILDRWLRNPTFRRAYDDIQQTLRIARAVLGPTRPMTESSQRPRDAQSRPRIVSLGDPR